MVPLMCECLQKSASSANSVIDGKANGAKVCVIDTRLSNTATKADYWLSPWPGSEAAMLLAMCRILLEENLFDREFVRKWVNWEEYLRHEFLHRPQTFEVFVEVLKEIYSIYTPEFAAQESGVDARSIVEVAHEVARAGSAVATHVWRNAAAGNLGGYQRPARKPDQPRCRRANLVRTAPARFGQRRPEHRSGIR